MAILVIKLKHIGDTLLMTPAIRHLKQCFPDEPVCALVRGGCEATLAGNPDLAEVFTSGRLGGGLSVGKKLAESRALLAWLRRWKFRLVVDFSSSDRGAICSRISSAKERVAYEPVLGGFLGKRKLYTRLLHDDRSFRHEVEKDFRLAQFATGHTGGDAPSLVFHVSDADASWAESRWAELKNGAHSRRILCHATSRWMFKCWQDDKVAATLDALLERGGLALLTAGQNDAEHQRALSIRSKMKRRAELIDPPLALPRLAAMMRAADLFIGIDSGPMHLAAAVGVPTVALFGPTPPARWRPWSERAVVVEGPCDCRKVRKYSCPKTTTMRCLAAIEPAQVIAAAESLLGKSTP